MSCAICLSELPSGLFGYCAPFSGWSFVGSASFRIFDASNDSFAVPPRVPATASPYIDSKDVEICALCAPPRMPNCAMFVIATAPPLPERMRGSAGESATARSGDAVWSCLHAIARDRNPSSVDFTPGVPDSMKSCASKCERVVSGLPTAWTTASDLSLKYGAIEASDGCAPKKPSRSMTSPRGMAIEGRAA